MKFDSIYFNLSNFTFLACFMFISFIFNVTSFQIKMLGCWTQISSIMRRITVTSIPHTIGTYKWRLYSLRICFVCDTCHIKCIYRWIYFLTKICIEIIWRNKWNILGKIVFFPNYFVLSYLFVCPEFFNHSSSIIVIYLYPC